MIQNLSPFDLGFFTYCRRSPKHFFWVSCTRVLCPPLKQRIQRSSCSASFVFSNGAARSTPVKPHILLLLLKTCFLRHVLVLLCILHRLSQILEVFPNSVSCGPISLHSYLGSRDFYLALRLYLALPRFRLTRPPALGPERGPTVLGKVESRGPLSLFFQQQRQE